jgi:hypothetical protein
MNNWNESELTFRCERLSARLERLAQNFLRMATLSQDVNNADDVLDLLQESKSFVELTALDLDVDSAFELAQIQRQLARWHRHWSEIWMDNSTRLEIATITQPWVERVREMAGVLI